MRPLKAIMGRYAIKSSLSHSIHSIDRVDCLRPDGSTANAAGHYHYTAAQQYPGIDGHTDTYYHTITNFDPQLDGYADPVPM